MLRGVADCFSQALPVAIIHTTIRNVAHYIATELVKAIFFIDDQLCAYLLGVIFQAVTTGLIFYVWMDVGIVPEKGRLNAVTTQGIDTIDAAGSAASVH